MAARSWEDKLKDKIKKHFLIDAKVFLERQSRPRNSIDTYENYCYDRRMLQINKRQRLLKKNKMPAMSYYDSLTLTTKQYISPALLPKFWHRLLRPRFYRGRMTVQLATLSNKLERMKTVYAGLKAASLNNNIKSNVYAYPAGTKEYSKTKPTLAHKTTKVLHRNLNLLQLGKILAAEKLRADTYGDLNTFYIKEEDRLDLQQWSSSAAYAFYMRLKQLDRSYDIVRANAATLKEFNARISSGYCRGWNKRRSSKYLFTIQVNNAEQYEPLISASLLHEEAEHACGEKLSKKPFQKILTVWHGAPFSVLRSILHGGLIINGSSGLLGQGIYTTPDIAKTYSYTGKYTNVMLIVECSIRPGIILASSNSEGTSIFRNLTKDQAWPAGFQATFAGPKYRAGAHAKLAYSEYAVYDRRQVQVTALHIYRPPIKEA